MENSYRQQSTRRQSSIRGAGEGFEVLMDGSQSYWKTRSNLDVLIVNHPQQMCFELVVYNAEIGMEAPRIYISSVLLVAKIKPDSVDFKDKLSAWKEILIRQKKTINIADLRKEVYNELMVKYILRRLNVDGEADLKKELRVTLLALADVDVEVDQKLDVICDMPSTLDPVKVTFTRLVSATEILRAQHLLNNEREKLVHALHLAELLSTVADNLGLIVQTKRKLERAMLPQPRLRWIRAINQVLVLNYIEKVKSRLLRSHCAAWYQAVDMQQRRKDAAPTRGLGALPLVTQALEDKTRPNTVLPAIDTDVAPAVTDPMQRRRQSRAEKDAQLESMPRLGVSKSPLHREKQKFGSPKAISPKSSFSKGDRGDRGDRGDKLKLGGSKRVGKKVSATDKIPSLLESCSASVLQGLKVEGR